MLTPSGAKVVDFGLAAVAGQAELDDDGELRGTPAYLAPERLTGGEVTPASDVYALGLLIHRALTNDLPWQAETTTQMLNAHVYVEPAPLPPTNGVLPEVNQICHRCLAKNPADRPSASEVAAVLADAAGIVLMPLDDRPGPAPADLHRQSIDPAGPRVQTAKNSDPGRRQRRRPAVFLTGAVAAVVAAVVTVALGVLLDRHGARPGDGSAAALPGPTSGPSLGTGAASQAPSVGPAGSGASVEPIGPGLTRRPVNQVSPTPRTTQGSSRPPTSAAGAASSRPALPGTTVNANGGVVRARCDGKKAQILSLDVAVGYTVDEYRPGPADEVKAVLISAANRSEIRVRCEGGAVASQVKETPQ
jgi:serine/threonine-protein kinase